MVNIFKSDSESYTFSLRSVGLFIVQYIIFGAIVTLGTFHFDAGPKNKLDTAF